MPEAVGISIGIRSIDLIQLTGSFRRPRIAKASRVDLGTPILTDPQAVSSLGAPLKQLLTQARLGASPVRVGIASEAAILRYFQMPKLPQADWPTAVRFEAKKYLPFKLEELVSDFRVVILKHDPKVMRVIFCAAKKELIAQYLQLLTQAAIQPRSLETNLSALTRLLRRNRQLDPQKTCALLFVEQDVASIAMVRSDLVYLTRNVTVLPQTSATGEAAAGPATQPADLHTILLNETSVSVDYYRRRFAGEPPVAKVLVCGDHTPPTWLADLSSHLELPVEMVDAGRGLAGQPKLTGNAAVACGLALRALEPRRADINLLPTELKPKPQGIFPTIALEVGAAAAALAVLYTSQMQPIRTLTAELAAIPPPPVELGLSPTELTVEGIRQRAVERQAELDLLRGFLDARTPLAAALSELATVLPDELWLQRILFEDRVSQKSLSISGSAYNASQPLALEAINRYVTALNQGRVTDAFGTFNLTQAQRGRMPGVEVMDFQLASESRPSGQGP